MSEVLSFPLSSFPLSFPSSEALQSVYFLLKCEGFQSLWESKFWQTCPFTWNREPFRKQLYSGEHCQGCGDESLREVRCSTWVWEDTFACQHVELVGCIDLTSGWPWGMNLHEHPVKNLAKLIYPLVAQGVVFGHFTSMTQRKQRVWRLLIIQLLPLRKSKHQQPLLNVTVGTRPISKTLAFIRWVLEAFRPTHVIETWKALNHNPK